MFRSAESEHPRLTNGEIISEESRIPTYVITVHQPTNVIDGQQTDRRNAIARPRLH